MSTEKPDVGGARRSTPPARNALAGAFATLLVTACAAVALNGACSGNDDHSGDARLVEAGVDAPRDAIGSPHLEALSVRTKSPGDGAPPSGLVPPFSRDQYDYYVRCSEGMNALTVSMKAPAGATARLVQPAATRSRVDQTLEIEVAESAAVVAEVTSGASTAQYWVRCLPHDFPPMQMINHPEAGTPPPGYYIVGTSSPRPGSNGYAIVLDGFGVPVWYATSGRTRQGIADVDMFGSGKIGFLRNYRHLPIIVDQFSPPETTYAAPDGALLDTHEFQTLPNGDVLVVSNPTTTADLTGLSIPLGDGGAVSFGSSAPMYTCHIVEFDPTSGNVVWTWDASDYFDPVKDTLDPAIVWSSGKPIADPYHCNSIDIDPDNQNLLISSKCMDSIFYVERPSGRVVWKMGGKPYTKNGAQFVPVPDPFYWQHDARLGLDWSAACGAGQVSVFDDHEPRPGTSRALLMEVVTGAPLADGGGADCGAAASGTPGAKTVWEYRGTAHALARGSFRILPDGSWTIGWGTIPKISTPLFTEVDQAKRDFRDFYFLDEDVSYRAIKVPASKMDLDALRAGAGKL